MAFVFDTGKTGLKTIMKEYQVIAIRHIWSVGEEGANSGETWVHVSKVLLEQGRTISRASIIFFLNDMVDRGALNYREKSGKGGYHRIYMPIHDEKGFKEYLAQQVIKKLLKEFPEEASKALKKELEAFEKKTKAD